MIDEDCDLMEELSRRLHDAVSYRISTLVNLSAT